VINNGREGEKGRRPVLTCADAFPVKKLGVGKSSMPKKRIKLLEKRQRTGEETEKLGRLFPRTKGGGERNIEPVQSQTGVKRKKNGGTSGE